MLKFKKINYDEVDFLKNMKLRQADIDELRAGTGMNDAWSALKYSVENSTEWTEVCYDEDTNEIITVFGLAKIDDGYGEPIGVPWMMASPSLNYHRKVLIRYSRKVIKEMLEEFSLLANYVDSRNELHIHWLKFMGFEFNGRDVIVNGVPFKYFYKRRE